jgi:hypothetical protein
MAAHARTVAVAEDVLPPQRNSNLDSAKNRILPTLTLNMLLEM